MQPSGCPADQANLKNNAGFTLFEVVIVIFILLALSGITVGSLALWQKISDLNNSIQEFANTLKFAQSKTLSSESDSQYGVYIDTSLFPNQYVLFKGINYALRVVSFDQVYVLPKTVEFFGVNLGSGTEVVFDRLTGFTQQPGNVSMRLIQDPTQTKTVYIANSGIIDFALSPLPSDDFRVKDSRHVHFDYSKTIDTANELVRFTFGNSLNQIIPIAPNLVGGQFYWQGTMSFGNSDQTFKIRTHRLNSPNTQFSVTRDRSLNNAPFKITLFDDSSGDLINYSADGTTTTYSSIYVSNLVWQ